MDMPEGPRYVICKVLFSELTKSKIKEEAHPIVFPRVPSLFKNFKNIYRKTLVIKNSKETRFFYLFSQSNFLELALLGLSSHNSLF